MMPTDEIRLLFVRPLDRYPDPDGRKNGVGQARGAITLPLVQLVPLPVGKHARRVVGMEC